MSTLDRIRVRGWKVVTGLGGRVGQAARTVNDALGRPLADEAELADRRAFEAGYGPGTAGAAPAAPPAPAGVKLGGPAPVVVFTLDDKRRGDVPKIVQILEDAGIAFELRPLDNDPAGLAAVRRDSGNKKPPLVFVAGESVGGRAELINLGRDGLRKLVFG